jgi:hypothetical protein
LRFGSFRLQRALMSFSWTGQVFPQHQCLAVPCCQLVALFGEQEVRSFFAPPLLPRQAQRRSR